MGFVVVLAALLAGIFVSDFQKVTLALWVSYGLLALSLDFVWGRAGIFSFGQTAMFGLGGYCFGIVGINYFSILNESWTSLVAAILIGTVFAALLGYFMFYGRL